MHSPFLALLILAIFALAGVYGFTELGEHMREQMLDELWDAPIEPRPSAADQRQMRESRPANDSGSHRARKVGGASQTVGGPVAASSFPTATGHADPRVTVYARTRGTV